MLVTPTLELCESGLIEEIIWGEVKGTPITPELILLSAIGMMIPLATASLSLTLRDSINRWANTIVAIVFAVLGPSGPIEYLARQSAYSAHISLIGIVELVVAALIVWYALKPKQKTRALLISQKETIGENE